MDSSANLKVGKNRTCIDEGGKGEFVWENQEGSMHLIEEPKCHNGLAVAYIASHKRSPRNHIAVRHFVEQFLCMVDSEEPEITVNEMVGREGVI